MLQGLLFSQQIRWISMKVLMPHSLWMASGALLEYQWMKDNIAISDTEDLYSGTDSDTLTVLSVDPSDEGDYTVTVSNDCW